MRLGDIHLHLAFRKLTVRLSVSIILTGNYWKLCIVIPMGEINTYDDRGNLIRTKQIDGTIDKPAMTEYDYNEHDLLVEKREYYNIGELSGKTVYEYDTNGLLAQTQVYDLLSRDRPETHFIYEYSDSNRVVKKYRIDDEGNKELESGVNVNIIRTVN